MMTDPVANLLTIIRNGCKAKLDKVDVPSSKLKIEIGKILQEEGYIEKYKFIADDKQGILRIYLKFDAEKSSIISGIKRISKPGRRVYVNKNEIPYTLNNLGVTILSTSKGLMTDNKARKTGIGGELLCQVW